MAEFSLGGLPIQFDYTARDFASIRAEMLALAESLTPEWTDFSAADPGVVTIESVAQIADVLHYIIDRAQNEGYLLTAQERSSVVKILRLIGYELSPRSAASVELTVVTDQPNVVIPVGQRVTSVATPSTPSQVFEFLTAVTLVAAGTHTVATDPGLVAVHGESVNAEAVGTSDGSPNQRFTLAQYPLALNPDGSSPLRVFVNAVEWTLAGPGANGRSFLTNEPDDEVFTYLVDAEGRVEIRFGDGVNGKIPSAAATITSDYRTGGGAEANAVGKNTVTLFDPPIAGVVSVTNPEQPSGGADAETIAHAKKHGPLSLRTLDRAVTLEDFETLAKQVPGGGIKASRAEQGDSPWVVRVYLLADGTNPVPTGEWFPRLNSGTGLVGGVGRFLTERKAVPARLEVLGCSTVAPRMDLTIYALPNYLRSAIRGEVQDQLLTLFESVQERFGVGIPQSRVVQVVENTPGVDWVHVNAHHRAPVLRVHRGLEAPLSLATLSLSGINAQTVADTYQIRWQTATTFTIEGSLNRLFDKPNGTYVFAEGVDYNIRLYPLSTEKHVPAELVQFDFRLDLDPVTRPVRGDIWRLGVDSLTGNINVLPYEVVRASILAGNQLDSSEVTLRVEGGIGR